MPAYVVVHHKPSRTPEPAPAPTARGASALQQTIARHHGTVLPADVTPGADPLVTTIRVADMAQADSLAAAVRELDDVETAYAKPGEELP